jgi:hypothetical protein
MIGPVADALLAAAVLVLCSVAGIVAEQWKWNR